jgi:hypothetical protein
MSSNILNHSVCLCDFDFTVLKKNIFVECGGTANLLKPTGYV